MKAGWFELLGGGSVRVDTLWRIVAGGRIQASSSDPGQRFGLPKPVDSAVRAAQVLSNIRSDRTAIHEAFLSLGCALIPSEDMVA